MQDRTPTPGQEGRALITPEDGSPAYYATIEMADNPTQEGTPYDKTNVLQDVTCDTIGIPHTSTPNEAFLALALGVGQYGYIITVLLPDGSPVPGATLTGISAPNGGSATTNENGQAVGVSEEQSVTIGVTSPYIDMEDASGVTVESTGILTPYNVTLQPKDTVNGFLIQTSNTYDLSPAVLTFDLTAVGGGGGGSNSDIYSSGPGGGGGYVNTVLNVPVVNERNLSIVVGAGAISGYPGTTGGTTTVSLGQSVLVSATGGGTATGPTGAGDYGSPGVGNGNGGGYNDIPNASGKPGTGYRFNDENLGVAGGGGGGLGGVNSNYPAFAGGAPFGGAGTSLSPASPSSSGTGPGGGGGGGGKSGTAMYQTGANGATGGVYMRCHYAQEVSA